eukprot:gene14610-16765_t
MSLDGVGLLLSLARSLQVEILVHWLELTDMGRLDSAVCSKTHRESFLGILKEDYCVFQQKFRFAMVTSFAWVLKRSVKMIHAAIPDCSQQEQLQYFTLCGKHTTSLTNENITGTNFEDHRRCENLTALVCNIASTCPRLEQLKLYDSNFYDNDVDAILASCPNLTKLKLNFNRKMPFRLLAGIWNIPNKVTYLDIEETTYHLDSAPCVLNDNHTLLTLYAANQTKDRFILPFILKCQALRVLVVDNLDFDDMDAIFTACTTLTALSLGLDLPGGSVLTDDGINDLVPLIQNLSALHLCGAEYVLEVDESQILTIIQNCPKLRSLSTEHLQDSETAEKYALLDSEPHIHGSGSRIFLLESLEVNVLSPATLSAIVALCPNLTSLNVTDCSFDDTEIATDGFFAAIGQSKIRSLEIGNCTAVTTRHVLHLRNLTALSLTKADKLVNSDVIGIVDRNPLLTSLHIIESPRLTRRALLYILMSCAHLVNLTFNSCDTQDPFREERSKSNDLTFMYELANLYRPTLNVDLVQIEL